MGQEMGCNLQLAISVRYHRWKYIIQIKPTITESLQNFYELLGARGSAMITLLVTLLLIVWWCHKWSEVKYQVLVMRSNVIFSVYFQAHAMTMTSVLFPLTALATASFVQ